VPAAEAAEAAAAAAVEASTETASFKSKVQEPTTQKNPLLTGK
jgi:hypothetical protein